MLVVVIIGLLAGFLIFNLAGTGEKAKIDIATSMCKGTLSTAIEMYHLHTGSYPTSDQWPQALLTRPSDAQGWHGPYLNETAMDPWNKPYQYKFPGVHNPSRFDVYSMGPDKTDGTPDDIGNWTDTSNQ